MDELLIGVLGGLITFLLVELLGAVWRFVQGVRGELAGWWLQITYDAQDADQDPMVWSIELVWARHRKEVRGRMYRVYPYFFQRRWRFAGAYAQPALRGTYDQESPDAGSGVFHMLRVTDGLYGEFMQTIAEVTPDRKIELRRESAALEWARVDRATGELWKAWLESCPRNVRREFTRQVRRQLFRPSFSRRERVTRALAAASAIHGPGFLLEHLRASDRSKSTGFALLPEQWAATALRRSDILGRSPVHPRVQLASRTLDEREASPGDARNAT